MINQVIIGDSFQVLKTLESNSVDCCVTSPPYYGLRDYGVNGQLGQEKTPELFIENLVKVFREVRRVLKDEGTLWINIGDSYWGGKGMSGSNSPLQAETRSKGGQTLNKPYQHIGGKDKMRPTDGKHPEIKPKDLIGIPWMLAFALRADGWYLRQDIIWSKTNCMPESVKDRCTNSHEYIFLFSKSKKYYFDQIKEPTISNNPNIRNRDISKLNTTPGRSRMNGLVHNNYDSRNKRSVWNVPTSNYQGSHYAVFPKELIVDCIKAGCPKGGIVIDPFIGSGTTDEVAEILGRNWIGIDLDNRNLSLIQSRLQQRVLDF